MQVSMAQVKLGTVRTILRLMPLLLMGGLTLLTFWLVQKNTPLPANVIERPRLRLIWNLNRYAVCAKTLGCILLVETQQPGIKVGVNGDRLPVD